MRLVQALREIFYFPFYFVSLNVAGFLSFVRFVHGSQPASWEKGDRVAVRVLCAKGFAEEKQNEEKKKCYEDEGLDYPRISSSGMQCH